MLITVATSVKQKNFTPAIDKGKRILYNQNCKRLHFIRGGVYITIYDVAKKAGVSTATVSRVINGSNTVTQRTKDKVELVMKELAYTPNHSAISLATNRTFSIGIMLPDVTDTFHSTVAYLLESKLMDNKYTSILCNTGGNTKKIIDYLETLYSKNVDGIILVGSSYNDPQIKNTILKKCAAIPMVFINAKGPGGTHSIICQESEGIKEALLHLKAQGKKNPVFVRDTVPHQKVASSTKEYAFFSGMKEVFPDVLPLSYSPKRDVPSIKAFLTDLPPGVDAILCVSDLFASYIIKACGEISLQVPQKMAVVGFNNSFISEITTPAITTVDHHIEECCTLGLKTLFQVLNGEVAPEVTHIKPHLIIKKST